MAKALNRGDAFPEFSLDLVDGRRFSAPQDLTQGRNVLLFYRGSW